MSTTPETQDTATATPESDGDVGVQTPDFQKFTDSSVEHERQEISCLADIKVTVSAELGRTAIPIERLLSLGTGSVLELDRSIDSPIELIAQGISLASGEVVVVDGCFAIRITNVYPRNRRGESLSVEQKQK